MKNFYLLLLIGLGFLVSAQTDENLKPQSWKLSTEKNIDKVKLSAVDLTPYELEDAANANRKDIPYRFGVGIDTNFSLSNSGKWTTLKNGDRVWILEIESSQAQSMNFVFSNFFLPEGATLHLYNSDHSDVQGAYTSANNNPAQKLGSWIVKGDKVLIEYYEPLSVINQGSFTISSVYHGYRTYEKQLKDLNDSGDCNLDVDCGVGADFQSYKDSNEKAVGMILTVGATSGWCSGSLINNTAIDGTPYFLTANHCMNGVNAATVAVRLGWISPVPDCATTANSSNGPTNMLINGSVLKANSAASDFALLQLNSSPPAAWNRVYAGWDRSGNNPTFAVGIHHPSGDVMKICRDNTGPIQGVNAGAQTWQITTAGGGWEMGVTEPGSSGSPLFDQNGRIIGQLYGGAAACSGTTDNGQLDYYGRFNVSWTGGGTNETRLSNWLDPINSGLVTLDNTNPPIATYNTDAKIAIDFGTNPVCGSSVQPTLVLENKGTNTLTSATISYYYDNETPTTINWTGSLAQNVSANIQLPVKNLTAAGAHTLNASVSNPNNTTDENTNNDSSSYTFNLIPPYNTPTVQLTLVTDNYCEETSWQFRDDAGTVLYSGGPYVQNQEDGVTFNYTFNVTLGNCYVFEIFDSYGDGMCCVYGIGSYTLKDSSGNVINNGGSFGSSEQKQININSPLGVEDVDNSQSLISITPNPSSGIFQVNLEQNSNLNYSVYSTNGALVKQGSVSNINNIIDLTSVEKGVYIVQFENNQSYKLIRK